VDYRRRVMAHCGTIERVAAEQPEPDWYLDHVVLSGRTPVGPAT
jgi:hypothetical protein